MRAILVCPVCKSALEWLAERSACSACGRSFQTAEGVPVLVPDAARTRRHDADDPRPQEVWKASQAKHFDGMDEAFEISRPSGAPALYRWMIEEKMRRCLEAIGRPISGMTVLVVCGGSGMEAEYLARAGGVVITSDISLGASGRASLRAARHGVALGSMVADVEQLPLGDRSVDIAFVHDGLHHLADPFAGIAEMARVARELVVISEPAKARLTEIAVQLGLARASEEAGNVIGRLDRAEVERRLRAWGFEEVRAERYALYYRHVPGRLMRLLSRPPLLACCTLAWRALNAALGRFGNKVLIVASRQS